MKNLQKVVKYIESELPEVKIYLFGSRANGTAKPNSDYDILLDWNGQKIPLLKMSKIYDYIENLPILIDVVDFNAVDTIFKKYVYSKKLYSLN